MQGRTISIFIPDGNARSVKICDIQDSIVKAVFIPRNKLEEVSGRKEIQDPGVYFLIGADDEAGRPTIYIGEAENLLVRLKQHNATKDFWSSAICFISDKRNLNKAHIKYLESYCCNQAKKINRCKLENSTTPTQSSLTESDIAFVMSFFYDLKVLISTLGYPVFEETRREERCLFVCEGKDAQAEGEYTVDGFVVFKGSKANLIEATTASDWIKNTRAGLIKEGVLQQEGKVYTFLENYNFNSPSAAAAIVLARNANGWIEWKYDDGKTLNEVHRQTENDT